MNVVKLIHPTKSICKESLSEDYFQNTKRVFEREKNMVFVSFNDSPKIIENLTPSLFITWKQKGYEIVRIRQVLTEKFEYR